MENSEAEANRSRDLATANMVALIFYVVVAVALVTLAVWSMTVSYMRRSSPSVPALPDRQRRRQRANPEAVTRIGTVSRLMLDRFPIRLYRNQDEDTMNQKTGADRGAARDPESAIPEMTDTRDATAEIQVVSSEDEEDMGTLKPRLENNEDLEAPCVVEETQLDTEDGCARRELSSEADLCVICLDAFQEGESVRELPCKHFYHQWCIDPWLTQVSPLCPLCKADTVDLWSGSVVPGPPTPPPSPVDTDGSSFPRRRWRIYLSFARRGARERRQRNSIS